MRFSLSRLTLVGACALLAGAPAAAEAASSASLPRARAAATPPRSADPAPKARAKKKRAERKGPRGYRGLDLDDVSLDAKADQKRDEQIEQLKKIIPKVHGPQRADLLFQLAELWWQKSKYVAHRGVARYDEALAGWVERSARGEDPGPEPRFESFIREGELYRQEALRKYDEILREWPGYDRRDEVLFAFAYNKYELGQKQEAVEKYEELIRLHPGSRFVADAHVQLAEHAFETNQLERAREAYQQALESGRPEVRHFALYKLAWCDFNAGAYKDAIGKFQEVVAQSQAERGSAALRQEALNDLVPSYAQLEAVEDALAYLPKAAPAELARRLLAKLAEQLQEAGRHESAIRVWRELLTADGNDPRCPEYQNAIVTSYEALRKRDRVVEEMRRLVERYRPDSAWAKANAGQRAAVAAAYELTEGAMRTLVTDYHQEAQKTKAVETYRLARDIYREYLEHFADSDNAYALRFFYAEILWALNEFEPAAAEYLRVAAQNPKGNYSKQAAYDAVLCYEKLVDVEQGKLRIAELKSGEKIDEKKAKGRMEKARRIERHEGAEKAEALPPMEAKLVDAIDRYVAAFAGGADEITLRYKAAFVFYDHHDDLEAARRFGEIIGRWPQDDWSRKAADLSLDLLNRRQAWLELNRLARAFASNTKLLGSDKAFATRVADLVEASQYKHIDETVYKAERNPAQAAAMFREFAREHPRSKYAAQARLYAMVIHAEANQLDQAIDAGETLLRDLPEATTADGQDLVPRTLLYLGAFHEKVGDFARAADAYERYAERFLGVPAPAAGAKGKPASRAKKATLPTGEEATKLADALYNAALFNAGLGRFERAALAYGRYLEHFGERADAPEVAWQAAALWERRKDAKEAAKAFRAFAERFGKRAAPARLLLARHREGLALLEAGQEKEGRARLEELTRLHDSLPAEARASEAVRDAYAQARFLALEPLWKEYAAIRFDKLGRLKRDLQAKLQMIEKVEKACAEVIALGSPEWAIASLTRIGLAYQDFARNLVESPDPPGLAEEELVTYRAELENRAFPLEAKALEAFEKANAKSADLAVYGTWARRAQDEINRVQPGTFLEVRELRPVAAEHFPKPGPVLGDAPGAAAGQGGAR